MSDLISRQTAIEAIVNTVSRVGLHDNSEVARYGATFRQHEIINIIESLPSAQPERKKGKWIKVGHWGRSYKCNQCGNYLNFDGVNAGRGDANFCPNCGADMRGESDDQSTI